MTAFKRFLCRRRGHRYLGRSFICFRCGYWDDALCDAACDRMNRRIGGAL